MKKKYFLNLSYLIILSLFLIAVYYLTIYCCQKFFLKTAVCQNFEKIVEQNFWKGSAVSEAALNSPGVALKDNTIIFSTFFDSFSNDRLINKTASNLYRDDLAAAVYFPPLYTWEAASIDVISKNKEELNNIYLNEFSDALNSSDRRCLGKNCLEQKGARLTYKGRSLVLPKEVRNSNIVGLTIGSLETNWLIGVTVKEGDTYQGRVYLFDGSKFTALIFSENSTKITSQYFGLFGFGGHESDFLVIYGAYRGQAYRLQESKVTDISRFFDFRVMATGFRPEVIRATNGRLVNWYIYSSSLERPRLIKLWPNERGEISGEVDYKELFPNEKEAAPFRLLESKSDEFVLIGSLKKDNTEEFKVLSDQGFNNKVVGELMYNPIAVDSEINIKSLADSKLGSLDASCQEGKLFFSDDANTWRELPCGENLKQSFSASVKNSYLLKINLPAQTESFYSPFLDEVLFDFYYQK